MKEPNRARKNDIKYNVILNEEQKQAKQLIIDNQIVIVTGRAGCLALGTKVLMYDSTYKNVEDVVVGNLLMGVDSTPRTVLNLKRGREQMYWIRQNKGLDYRVNASHILSLKNTKPAVYSRVTVEGKRMFDYTEAPIHLKEDIITNISVLDYINLCKNVKGW